MWIYCDLESGFGVQWNDYVELRIIVPLNPKPQLVFHIFAALAEFERNVIHEWTLAGLKAARARGRLGGRPEKLSSKDKQQISVLLKDPGVRVKDVAKRFGVSVITLYKHVGVVTPEK